MALDFSHRPAWMRGIELRDGARQRQQQRESMLGDAHRVAAGRVHYQDAAARGFFDVYVVDAYAGAAYYF